MFKVGDIVKFKNHTNQSPYEIMLIDDENFVYIKLLNSNSSLSNYKLLSIKSLEYDDIYYRKLKIKKIIGCLK